MNTRPTPSHHDRFLTARPFLITALVALLAGGLIAGAVAHAPTRPMVWMVAYLVLVVGLAQAVLGAGQAWLPVHVPASRWRWGEWWLFNLGNAGVIIGRLCESTTSVAIGTALFVIALVLFVLGVRREGRGWLLNTFRAVLVITALGACTGLALTVAGLAH